MRLLKESGEWGEKIVQYDGESQDFLGLDSVIHFFFTYSSIFSVKAKQIQVEIRKEKHMKKIV
jgi:hypothetical protein